MVVEFQTHVELYRNRNRNRFGMKHIYHSLDIYIYKPRQGSEGKKRINKIK